MSFPHPDTVPSVLQANSGFVGKRLVPTEFSPRTRLRPKAENGNLDTKSSLGAKTHSMFFGEKLNDGFLTLSPKRRRSS